MDAAEAIIVAIEQLARAMTDASPEEMARVHARLAQRSLPSPSERPVEPTLAIVVDPRPPAEHSLARRLRSWTRARLAAPMQRARALLARAA